MAATILIVEDEAVLARNIQRFLKLRGDDPEIAGTMEAGLEAYGRLRPDVILMDHNLPDGTGLELLKRIRSQDRQTKIVMMTAHGSVQIAVEAMKAGADDYLAKPMALDEIGMLVAKLVDQARLEGSLSYFKQREERRGGIDQMIGESAPMRELKDRIQRLVSTEARLTDGPPPAVLILGETGTGKELIARALHYGSARRAQPFIELNCAALPEHLVESELFGHERGAFTDAKERKQGLFVAADKGTLFLDEVGELPLPIQAKLLKTLEQRTVRPVGSVRERAIDVRVVAATNTAIEDQVRNGEFRSDLFFRLGVVTINAPPLRERGGDVILLAEHFLEQFSRSYGRQRLTLAPGAAEALRRHPWPGNVRELRNVMEQAVLFTVGQSVEADDLRLREPMPLRAPAAAPGAAPDPAAKQAGTLTDVERDLIQRALASRKGNVTLAARDLGISRDTLRYRMERHGLRREQFV